MNHHFRISLAALFVFLLTFVGCKKEETPEPETPQTEDFWEEAGSTLGLNVDSLQLASNLAEQSPSFYALLVIRHDSIALERYYRGKNAASLFHLRSITKNFTSALTGIAIEEGLIGNLDDQLRTYLPDANNGDKENITIRHLLNMTSGLTWHEEDEVLPLLNQQIANPVQTILARPLATAPGEEFNYNSVLPHMVSHILAKKTGKPFENYAEEKLFDPLGIAKFDWTRDPNGEVWGGFGLQLTARDLARLGKLYLDGGQWDGVQLVPAEWVQESGSSQISFGTSNNGYSLQWWTSENFGTIYYGQGYGGQALMILPEQDMIVVACQAHFVPQFQHLSQWRNFADHIFPVIFRAIE